MTKMIFRTSKIKNSEKPTNYWCLIRSKKHRKRFLPFPYSLLTCFGGLNIPKIQLYHMHKFLQFAGPIWLHSLELLMFVLLWFMCYQFCLHIMKRSIKSSLNQWLRQNIHHRHRPSKLLGSILSKFYGHKLRV